MTKSLLPRNTIAGNPQLKAVLERVGFKTSELAAHILQLESKLSEKPDASAAAAAVPENMAFLESECTRLQSENSTLRARLGIAANATTNTTTARNLSAQVTPMTGRDRVAQLIQSQLKNA